MSQSMGRRRPAEGLDRSRHPLAELLDLLWQTVELGFYNLSSSPCVQIQGLGDRVIGDQLGDNEELKPANGTDESEKQWGLHREERSPRSVVAELEALSS